MAYIAYYTSEIPGAGSVQFGQWYSEHPGGFYLNIRGRQAMVHRVGCVHLGDPRHWNADDGDVTRSPKVCSVERRTLEAWAREQGKALTACADCS